MNAFELNVPYFLVVVKQKRGVFEGVNNTGMGFIDVLRRLVRC